MALGSRPNLGSGACSFVPVGLCPTGRPLDEEGKDGVSAPPFSAAGGWTAAAAPVQGSAVAGGATPIATQSPTAAADATDIDAIRGRGDMSHLSGGTTSHLTSVVG
jgi:hypothetical protein